MEKNFETLEKGCWYQRVDGAIVQVEPGNSFYAGGVLYTPEGRHLGWPLSISDKDLILKIEPPTIVPVKRKVKKLIKRYVNVYPDGSQGTYVTRELADTYSHEDRILCVEVTGEYEVEE